MYILNFQDMLSLLTIHGKQHFTFISDATFLQGSPPLLRIAIYFPRNFEYNPVI